MKTHDTDPLGHPSRAFSFLTASLLLTSFVCNIAALTLPFMTMRKGFSSEAYTMPHSVTMLWNSGLYVIATLVVGFSILFPFAKLAILAWVAHSHHHEDKKSFWLQKVEKLGKWSMLDAFLISIILSLSSGQFLVNAKPELGLTLFIIAVLLSMICGELLARRRHDSPEPKPQTESSQQSSGFLLLLYTATLFGSLSFPFLRIEEWFLSNHEYSIITLVPALWGQGAWLAALLTIAFLIAMPLFAWGTSLSVWISKRHTHIPTISIRYHHLAKRWSMLDVFGLSLTIFAIESDHIMNAEIRWGAIFLGASLLLQTLFSQALDHKKV